GSFSNMSAAKFGPLNDPVAHRNYKAVKRFFRDTKLGDMLEKADSGVKIRVGSSDEIIRRPNTVYFKVTNSRTGDEFNPKQALKDNNQETEYFRFDNPEADKPALVAYLTRAIGEADQVGKDIQALDTQLKDTQRLLKLKGLSVKSL